MELTPLGLKKPVSSDNADLRVFVGDNMDLIDLKLQTKADILDLETKVNVVAGKGLSTNDYTTDDKNKLANINPNANYVIDSPTNGNIVIDGSEVPVYSLSADLPNKTVLAGFSDNSGLLYNGAPIGGNEPQYIVKDAWSTTGTRTLSENMYKFYIYNTGSADLAFTINNFTTTVKATEEFEDEFDPFTQVTVTATSTFTANALGLKTGSPNPKYTVKDSFSGSSNITRSFTGNVYGIVISNDGESSLTYTVNGITVTVPAGDVSERYFNAFTLVSIITSVPYRACAKSTLNTVITGSTIDVTPPIITANPNGGTFTSAQSVTLTSNEASTIYYTVDGSTPTTSSSVYSSPISLSTNTTLKFLGKDAANNIGSVQTATFTINIDTTAPTVSISPSAGTFTSTQNVTLTPNETATIYYTLDGSTPTTSSTVYNSSISVSSTTTIKYFAKDTAGNSGTVQSATFTIQAADTTAPTVTASPNGGLFNVTQNVTLTANESATIYYTTDGSTPTISSSVYSTAIPISATTTVKFFGKDTANNTSTVQSITFTIDTTAPTITASVLGGTYTSAQTVTLTANETSTIYYTLDGSTPTTSSSVYSTALSINSTSTLKYFGRDTAGNSSTVQTQAYTINTPDTTAPTVTISPATGSYGATQSVTLSANETATIYYTLDGSTPAESSTIYSSAISVSATTTIKYFGKDVAGNLSTVQTATYTINTVAPTPVDSFTAGTPTSNSIPVNWTKADTSDVAKYEIAYSTDGTNFSVASGVINPSSTTYTVTGLTSSTLFTLRIVAIDSVNNRSTAVTTTATTSAISSVVVSDSFNRANTTSGLGSTDNASGGTTKAWEVVSGTWGIINNSAYVSTATGGGVNDFAVIDAGLSDCAVTLKFVTAGCKLVGRYAGSGQCYAVQNVSNAYRLYKWTSPTAPTLLGTSTGVTAATNDVVKLSMNGSTLEVYANGTLCLTVTDSTYASATKHGICGTANSERFDDFKIEGL